MLKRFKFIFTAALGSYAVSAAAIALLPFVKHRAAEYILAALFWLGLISGIIFALLSRGIRRFTRRNPFNTFGLTKRIGSYPGIFSFGKDRICLTVYAVFTVGLVLIISNLIFGLISADVMFTVIAATNYSFAVHCIIDGRNFKIYKKLKEGNRYVKNR